MKIASAMFAAGRAFVAPFWGRVAPMFREISLPRVVPNSLADCIVHLCNSRFKPCAAEQNGDCFKSRRHGISARLGGHKAQFEAVTILLRRASQSTIAPPAERRDSQLAQLLLHRRDPTQPPGIQTVGCGERLEDRQRGFKMAPGVLRIEPG
jgi:hypothetical protein